MLGLAHVVIAKRAQRRGDIVARDRRLEG
jgi:hypothetical protein